MGEWQSPVPGYSRGTPFGARGSMWSSGRHTGLDFPCPDGTIVDAIGSGKVIYAGDTGGAYGIQVKISHAPGLESWYCHLSAVQVKRGDLVSTGDGVGLSGHTGNVTGPHLHLEIRKNGVPVDPAPYLDGKKGKAPKNLTLDQVMQQNLRGTGQAGAGSGTGSAASTSADGGGADATNAGVLSNLIPLPDIRSMTLEALFLLGGFALVAAGAVAAASPTIKKAAETAVEATPEGAAAGAVTKGTR